MSKLKTLIGKTWVYVAAAAIIAGSSSTMAFALNNNIPENASKNAVPFTSSTKDNIQTQTSKAEITAEYSVIDLSKNWHGSERETAIKTKLSMIKGITPDQIEKKYNEIISNMTPGKKDVSAEQAAAYAADILKKAYGVDFTGYTAQASFSRSPVPNADSWTVIFYAPNEAQNTKRYLASVDSVNGTMLDASFYDLDYRAEEHNKNLGDPEWINKAQQKISKLLPENISIDSSKVVSATPETGVTVVCELSDGSACAVRLTGENKEAAAYIYFQNGYDGSLDYKPLSTNGVG